MGETFSIVRSIATVKFTVDPMIYQPLEHDTLSFVYSVCHSREIALFGHHVSFIECVLSRPFESKLVSVARQQFLKNYDKVNFKD